MEPNFCCFVEFEGHKYDIVINEDISSVCFEDIYYKIQQIIKLALNVVIVFESHIFEIIDNKSGKGLVVKEFDHFVKHLSIIRIHRNPNICPLYVNPFNPYIEPTVGLIPLSFPQSLSSNPLQNAVIPKTGDDFVPHEYYCEECPQSLDQIDPRLKKHKLNLNFESYKRYSDLMSTIKEMSNSNCDSISEYHWLNVVPYKMRAFGHKDFSPKLWKNSFEVFLKKYIEVMEVSSNRFAACSLFPFFHEFNAFRFDVNDCINYKKITDLRQKMNQRSNTTTTNDNKMKKEKRIKSSKGFNKLIKKLKDYEHNIKVFHLIVQLIDPTVSYRKMAKKNRWTDISRVLSRYGYSSKMYSAVRCRELFLQLSEFYALNYYKLNDNLDPELQKIFDLFKIVHILDFSKMWGQKNTTHCLLKKLSHREDIKQYLDELEERKLTFNAINREKETNTIPKCDDLSIVAMDLEDEEVSQEIDIIASNSTSLTQPSVSGEQCRTVIPRTDPRLNRLNCMIIHSKINSNVIPVSQDLTKDVKPINGNRIEPEVQTTVPRVDPRLKRKIIAVSNSSTHSNAITIPTEQRNGTTITSVLPKSPVHTSTLSHSSEAALPLKTSVPSIFDPRIRHKSYTTSNSNLGDITLCQTALHNSEKVFESKPINTSIAVQWSQPSSSLRDPRLKRKLEPQNEESDKQSSDSSNSNNVFKKVKLEPIESIQII